MSEKTRIWYDVKFHGPDIEASNLGLQGQIDDFQESNYESSNGIKITLILFIY